MSEKTASKTGASTKLLGAEIEMCVPFYDLDPLGMVWHGNYYKYFELARAEFMRSICFDIEEMRRSGYVWPVIQSNCSYVSPLRYDMKIRVRAELQEEEHRLSLRYWITEKETDKVLAKGQTVQAAVHIDTWEMCFITPDPLLRRIHDARKRLSP